MIQDDNIIPYSPEELFTEHLNIGEKLLWAGQPNPRVHFTSLDKILIPFSFLWCGFTIFWLVMIVRLGAPLIFFIFGIVFVFLGLNFVFGRFWTKARRKKLTYYAVSNQRILSLYQGRRQSFKETKISKMTHLGKEVRQYGIGTLTFGKIEQGFFSLGNHIF